MGYSFQFSWVRDENTSADMCPNGSAEQLLSSVYSTLDVHIALVMFCSRFWTRFGDWYGM